MCVNEWDEVMLAKRKKKVLHFDSCPGASGIIGRAIAIETKIVLRMSTAEPPPNPPRISARAKNVNSSQFVRHMIQLFAKDTVGDARLDLAAGTAEVFS